MYTKQEISKQKQAFWTAFGRYMKPVLSADGEEINWINYKTGNKYVYFKMDADSRQAQIAIVVQHPEEDGRLAYFDRLRRLKEIFEDTIGEQDWIWRRDSMDEQGRAVGVIQKALSGVNLLNNEDWPAIISFLKPRIIGLDVFWSMMRYEVSGV
jgi:deoxyribodipyrimidine photolyase-like uncharacterized protein